MPRSPCCRSSSAASTGSASVSSEELTDADGIQTEVLAAVEQAALSLEKAGATVDRVSVPSAEYGLSAYYLIAPAEASSNLARYDGVRYGLRVDGDDVAVMNARTREAGFGAEVKRRIMLGTYALSAGYYDAYYGQAQRVRTLIIRDFARAYEDFDVLLTPTSPTVAFELGAKTADPLSMYLSDICTIPTNLAGHPGMSVPYGTGEDGLPVGVQVLAPALGEHADVSRRPCARIEPDMSTDTTASDVQTDYEAVIGLEVHVELATATKMFCSCANEFGAEPNTHVCPVCLGLPGSLPVLNAQAVELVLRFAEAVHLHVPERSIFARKNYFYPDMPKDYQISQYEDPITVDGWLEIDDARIGIERAHLEEDTGKTLHIGGGGRIHEASYSLVDYNRAGVPLMEIVSRPDIRNAEQARAYVSELRGVLQAVGVSDVKLEEGSMRVDANVSVRPRGTAELGVKVEVKNMNSLRSLGRAIDYEIERQIAALAAGERIVQETRHWDEADGVTHSMRSKEGSSDYRYFPEPDLVPVAPNDEMRGTRPVVDAGAPGGAPRPARQRVGHHGCRRPHPRRRAGARRLRRGRGGRAPPRHGEGRRQLVHR